MMTDHDRDVMFLGLTAYAEASGEGPAGICAQVHSVINRFQKHQWQAGKTVASTCLRPYAFSAWNSNDQNRVRALSVAMDDPILQSCFQAADDALRGLTQDPTGGATHYYVSGTPEPNWVSGKNDAGANVAPPAIFTDQIGKHRFFKGVA